MKVRYTLTLNDLVALNLYLRRKSGVGQPALLVIWLSFPILCAVGSILLLQMDREKPVIVLAILALFWLVVMPAQFRTALARNTRNFLKKLGTHGMIGERTLILSEELLVSISETFRIEVRWENLMGVEVVGENTYIFITTVLVVILPRRGFESEAEYEATRDFALRKLEGHVAP